MSIHNLYIIGKHASSWFFSYNLFWKIWLSLPVISFWNVRNNSYPPSLLLYRTHFRQSYVIAWATVLGNLHRTSQSKHKLAESVSVFHSFAKNSMWFPMLNLKKIGRNDTFFPIDINKFSSWLWNFNPKLPDWALYEFSLLFYKKWDLTIRLVDPYLYIMSQWSIDVSVDYSRLSLNV